MSQTTHAGRPALAARKRRDVSRSFRITPAEAADIDRACAAVGESISDFARAAIASAPEGSREGTDDGRAGLSVSRALRFTVGDARALDVKRRGDTVSGYIARAMLFRAARITAGARRAS